MMEPDGAAIRVARVAERALIVEQVKGWLADARHAEVFEDHELLAFIASGSDEDVSEKFSCEAVIYSGPGHQSKIKCTRSDPHPLAGDGGVHYVKEVVYEWRGPEGYTDGYGEAWL